MCVVVDCRGLGFTWSCFCFDLLIFLFVWNWKTYIWTLININHRRQFFFVRSNYFHVTCSLYVIMETLNLKVKIMRFFSSVFVGDIFYVINWCLRKLCSIWLDWNYLFCLRFIHKWCLQKELLQKNTKIDQKTFKKVSWTRAFSVSNTILLIRFIRKSIYPFFLYSNKFRGYCVSLELGNVFVGVRKLIINC